MASVMFMALAVFALLLPSATLATQHIVGDDQGWRPGVDYQAWAAERVFRVGDTLVFKYAAGHYNVLRVNQTSFQQCIKSSDYPPLTSGMDIIQLMSPGMRWYICRFSEHCSLLHQKLAINVLEANAPAPAQTAASPSPSSYRQSSIFSIRAFLGA